LVAERWTDAKREHLAGLLAARQALIDHQIGLRNQISASPAGKARCALAALKPIPGVIKKLDQLIAAAIAEHPPFAALAARLDTVRRFAAPHRSEHIIGMSQRIGRRREGM